MSTDEIKLTKNEIRFSQQIRPAVGEVVEFSPVMILCKSGSGDIVLEDCREFYEEYIVRGAKCRVIKNWEHTVEVDFVDCDGVSLLPPGASGDIVSPDFLITRELTKQAAEAIEALKEKLHIQ